jgi:hypothetical protein
MNSGSKPVPIHFPTNLGGCSEMGWVFKTYSYSKTCSNDLVCGIVDLGVEGWSTLWNLDKKYTFLQQDMRQSIQF